IYESRLNKKLRGLAVGGLELRCAVNCLANPLVGSAAANVSAHKVINFGVSWTSFLGEQRGGRHDLPALAIATLRNIDFQPGLLHGMTAVDRQALDGGNFFAGHGGDWRNTGPRGFPLDVNSERPP